MKSRNLRTMVKISVLSLLMGLASPIQTAQGVDNITKTFVVRGSDDALLSGAFVRLGYIDPTTQKITYTATQTTNGSGEASITVPADLDNLNYVVFPPSGNTTMAPTAMQYQISNSITETIRVKLVAANFVVQVDNSSGTSVTATDNAILSYPNNASNEFSAESTMVLRSGAFGIKLPSALDATKNYRLNVVQFIDNWVSGRFSWRYGLKATGASGSQSYTVYSDLTYSTTVAPTGSVYKLAYKSGNIQGQLKNADGTTFTMPSGATASMRIVPDFQPSTASDYSNDFFDSTTSPNGNWNALLLGPAGRYKFVYSFNETTDVPSFAGFIWKNSAGGFSTVEAGPYTTSAPHQLVLRLPAAGNFKLAVVKPGTNTAMASSYQILTADTKTLVSSGNALNGQTAALVPNGSYILTLYPYDENYSEISYKLDAVSGVVTVKTMTDSVISPVSGIYKLSPKVPNLKVQAVSSASSSTVVQYSDFCIFKSTNGEGDTVGCRSTGTDWGGLFLDNGTYSMRVWPGNSWATYKESQVLAVTVTSGVATVTGIAADGNGIVKVPLSLKNFRYKIVQSASPSTAVPNSWIDYVKVNNFTDLTQDDSSRGGEGVDQNGLGGAVLSNGNWLISVNLGASSTDSKRYYKLEVAAGGSVTLRNMDNSTVTPTDGIYVISGQAANLTGSIKNASNENVVFANGQGINLTVQKWNSDKNYWDWTMNNSWRTSASFGFSLTDIGKYRIQASPYGFSDFSQSYSSEFEIRDDAGTKKWYQGSLGSAITTPLTLNVTMATPNFKIKLIDPRDNTLMKSGWISIIKKESNGNQFWVSNMDISSANPGLSGASLSDGDYRLEVNPQNGPNLISGLARKNYDLTVSSTGTSFALSYNGTAITAGDGGRYTLTPASSNITGRVVSPTDVPLTQGNNQWVNINVQKFISAENRWDWTQNWSNIDNQGFFSISVADIGKYRLRIEPNGFSDSTVTFSEEFEITSGNQATFNKAFGNIRMSAPALRARVTLQGSNSAISNIGVEVRKNGQWLDWTGTGPQGIASFSFKDTGTYELVAWPSATQMNQGATKKTYTAVVTKNSSGVFSATVSGLTPDANGIYSLTLGTGNLSGYVCKPGTNCSSDASNALENAQVVAIDTVTNRELWEYSANSSSTGKWSMNLPAGTYKIMARAPWGTSAYGNSDAISTVTINSEGNASLSGDAATGRTTSSFVMALKNPTWSGTIRTPSDVTDAVVPYATVCLYTNQIWNCANANASGQWAMSAPAGFTAFSSDSILEIRDDRSRTYPMLRFTNEQSSSAVSDALGGTSANNLVHRFKGSNFKVQVTATNSSGTSNVPYVWVSLDRVGSGWLGGGQTNAQGIASFNIDTATVTSGELNVRVEVGGNKEYSTNFAPTSKTVSVSTAIAGMTPAYTVTVPLDTPNLKGILREPGTNGATTPWSWIELFDDATNEWKGGSSTDDSGQFSMNVPKPTSGIASYTLRVNPPWNSSSLSSSRSYTVTVSSTNQVTVTIKGTSTAVSTEPVGNTNYYSFTLASPSVTGSVVNASNAGVRDSWVVPISATTGEYFWQQGVNSKTNGSIAMALADGSYKLEANVPWNLSGVAKSAQCSVTVASGSITTAVGGCVQAGGTVKLALRAPNVNLTLKYSGSPIANANVGLSIGAWYTNAQSKSDGTVSLFIDKDAVLAANPGLSGSAVRINVWVDPPYGNSTIVRWDCQSQDAKPLCQNLPNFNTASEYPTTNIGDVNFQGPNTRVKVVKADNSALQNAWVSLFAFEPGNPSYGVRWIGGSNSDSNGFASFNVDTTSATMRYRVEVNPPWNNKSTYSQKLYGDDANGLTWAQVNEQSFAIGTPNAKIIMKSPSGGISSWGWIGVEEVDSSNNFVKWVAGVGTDNSGVAAITLSSSKRYRLSANPGGGREGTRTECIATTSSDSSTALSLVSCSAGALGANNELTITLNNGNVNGTLLYGTTPIANAIVVATSTSGDVVPTTSAENGKFGLQLDASKTWSIKIFPVNSPTGLQIADKTISTVTFTSGSANLGNIPMVLKP